MILQVGTPQPPSHPATRIPANSYGISGSQHPLRGPWRNPDFFGGFEVKKSEQDVETHRCFFVFKPLKKMVDWVIRSHFYSMGVTKSRNQLSWARSSNPSITSIFTLNDVIWMRRKLRRNVGCYSMLTWVKNKPTQVYVLLMGMG